jgi:hypothetical protein
MKLISDSPSRRRKSTFFITREKRASLINRWPRDVYQPRYVMPSCRHAVRSVIVLLHHEGFNRSPGQKLMRHVLPSGGESTSVDPFHVTCMWMGGSLVT